MIYRHGLTRGQCFVSFQQEQRKESKHSLPGLNLYNINPLSEFLSWSLVFLLLISWEVLCPLLLSIYVSILLGTPVSTFLCFSESFYRIDPCKWSRTSCRTNSFICAPVSCFPGRLFVYCLVRRFTLYCPDYSLKHPSFVPAL